MCAGALFAVAMVLLSNPAQAQSFTWTGATTDYGTASNWSPSGGAPPVAATQSAIFDAAGSSTAIVGADPISPDSWTFNANAQSYIINGAAINFNLAGANGGVIDRANSGQSIEILNNIGGAGVQVQLLGNSALTLFGTNTYSGGTTVSGFGTLSVVSSSTIGTGVVTLEDGRFQAAALNLTFSNVPDLIAALRERAARGEIEGDYRLADITQDASPRCDAILCRDCLVHLCIANIGRALQNFRTSGATWLITTTFPEWQQNIDGEEGDWRALNFERAPFSWGPPVELINENCLEAGGGWRDKRLGVWRL